MEHALTIITAISFFIFCFLSIQLIQSRNKSVLELITTALLINCLVFHITYWELTQQIQYVFFFFFPLAVALPFTYCLFCKSYFSDDFFSLKKTILTLSVIYAIDLLFFLLSFKDAYHFLAKFGYIISFGILFYIIVIAFKGYQEDLIEKRRITRAAVILFNSLIGIALLISFSSIDPLNLPSFLLILALLSQVVFVFFLFDIKISFIHPVSKGLPLPENKNIQLHSIIEKVEVQIIQNKVYREEGMTISKLSKIVGEKEYLVRKAINTKSGYANFNQFLNHHKIEEAKQILRSSSSMSMKEIAYHLGYPNPSAFNRAFKKNVQMTPSEFKERVNL